MQNHWCCSIEITSRSLKNRSLSFLMICGYKETEVKYFQSNFAPRYELVFGLFLSACFLEHLTRHKNRFGVRSNYKCSKNRVLLGEVGVNYFFTPFSMALFLRESSLSFMANCACVLGPVFKRSRCGEGEHLTFLLDPFFSPSFHLTYDDVTSIPIFFARGKRANHEIPQWICN